MGGPGSVFGILFLIHKVAEYGSNLDPNPYHWLCGGYLMVPAMLGAVVSSPWLCGGHLMVPAMLCAVVSSPWLCGGYLIVPAMLCAVLSSPTVFLPS